MRKVIGINCIALGIVCLLSSVGFVICNYFEAKSAAASAQTMLQNIQTRIIQTPRDEKTEAVQDVVQTQVPASEFREMPFMQVEGYDCIGILSIPVLELELPVLHDWSYEKLKKAPCQYYGSCYETDFVIAAHNYPAHFGHLSELQPGDIVLFTDVAGGEHSYEVVLLETLPATATEAMITSGFGLSLYTCTTGGASRVTARCRLVSNS